MQPLAFRPLQGTSAAAEILEASKPRVVESYGRLPLSFAANQGQTDPQVKFLSRSRGYTLFLTAKEAVLALRQPTLATVRPETDSTRSDAEPANSQATAPSVLRMELLGANPAPPVEGREELPGKSNYFIGNDPQHWHIGVPTYARVGNLRSFLGSLVICGTHPFAPVIVGNPGGRLFSLPLAPQ